MEFGKYIGDEVIRKIFANSSIPMGVTRLSDTKMMEVNEPFLEASGYEYSDVVGKTIIELSIYEDLAEREKIISELFEKGYVRDSEVSLRVKSGEYVPCRLSLTLINYLGEMCSLFEVVDLRHEIEVDNELSKKSIIVDSTSDCIITTDLNGNVTSWNSGAEKLYSYSAEEVMGKSVSLLWKDEDLQKLRGIIDDLIAGKDIESFEAIVVDKHGRDVSILISLTPLKNENGDVVELLGITKDIGELKKTQKALVDSKIGLSKAQKMALLGSWTWDLETNEMVMSDELFGMMGLNKDGGVPPADPEQKQIFPDDRKKVSDVIDRAVKKGKSYSVDYRFYRYDNNELRDFHVEAEVHSSSKEGKMIYGIVQDVTERKKAEGKLKESEELFRGIFNSTPSMVAVIDLDTMTRVYVNDYEIELTGYTREELIGKSLNEISMFVNDKDFKGKFAEFLKVGSISDEEIDLKTKTGDVRRMSYSGAKLNVPGKNLALFIARDITEIKATQEALVKEQSKFKLYMNVSKTAFIAIDKGGRVTYINPAGCDVLGYDINEVAGLDWFDNFIPKKYREEIRKVSKKLLNGELKPVEDYENVVLTKGGEEKIFAWHNALLKDDEGKIIGHLSSGEEITEKKVSEMMLKESEEKHRTLLEDSGLGIGYYDLNGKILLMNKKACENLKTTPENLVGKYAKDAFGPEMGQLIIDRIKKTQMSEKALFFDDEVELPTGTNWYGSTYSNIKNSKGLIMGVQIISSDITEKKKVEEELKESRQRIIDAQKMAKLGYWYWDVKSGDVTWSDQVYETFGFKKDDFTPQIDSIMNLSSDFPEHNRRHLELIERVTKNKESGEFEQKFLRKDGSVGYYFSTFKGVFDSSGELIAIKGTVQDITEKKKAEEKLKKSEALLNDTQVSTKTGSWEWNVLTDEINWSDQMFRLMGSEPGEETPSYESVLQAVHPDDREYYEKSLKDAMDKKAIYDIENRVLIRGDEKYMHSQGQVVCNKSGDVIRMFGTVQDITERKKVEEKLKDLQNFQETILNSSPDIIYVYDLSKRENIYSNEGFSKILGYSSEEIKGMGKNMIKKLMHPGDFHRYIKYTVPAYANLKDGEVIEHEYRMKKKDGSWKWLHSRESVFVRDKDGKVSQLFGISSDITSKKKSEERIKEGEIKYKTLFDSMLNGFALHEVVLDKSGNPIDYIYLEANNAFEELTGISVENIKGKRVTEVLPGIHEDKTDWISIFGKVVISGKEERLENYSSELGKWFSVYAYSPKKGQFATIFEDITDKRKSEDKIRESQERFAYAMDATEDGLYDWNLVTNEIYYSPAWKKMLGYEYDELPNDFSIWENLTDPKDVKKSWEMQQQLISKEIDRFELEFKMKHKDGHWIDVLSRARAIFDEKGKAIRIVGTHIDLTEKKKAEREIHKSNEILRSVVDSASDMIFAIDSKGKIISWNSAAEYITGYKSWEILDKNIHSVEFVDCDCDFKELQEEDSILDVKVKCSIKPKYGRERKMSFTASGLELGDEGGVVFIGHEVTSSRSHSVEFGRSYMLKDNSDVYKRYLETLNDEYCSFFVSRSVPGVVENEMSKREIDVLLLKESNVLSLELLLEEIKKATSLKNNCVIFLDRIDYLITLYGFRSFLRFMYALNDYVSNSRYILLLNVNSNLLEVAEMSYLDQEIMMFPAYEGVSEALDPELVNILSFILENKKRNVSTSFKDIRSKFEISNVTTRKRLLDLVGKGLIEINKSGRLKVIEITDAGNELISSD